MKCLRNQLGLYEKATWTLAAAVVVGIGMFYVLGFRPANQALYGLMLKIQSRQRAIAETHFRARDLPSRASEVRRYESQLRFYDRQLPRQPAMDQFIKDLTGISSELSLRDWRFSPSAPERGAGYCELPIQIQFSGDFSAATAFVRRVEDLERLTRIKKLEFKSRDNRSGLVGVSLVASIYYVEGW
jgi:Tfp pilus assembly protein PilO